MSAARWCLKVQWCVSIFASSLRYLRTVQACLFRNSFHYGKFNLITLKAKAAVSSGTTAETQTNIFRWAKKSFPSFQKEKLFFSERKWINKLVPLFGHRRVFSAREKMIESKMGWTVRVCAHIHKMDRSGAGVWVNTNLINPRLNDGLDEGCSDTIKTETLCFLGSTMPHTAASSWIPRWHVIDSIINSRSVLKR